MPPQLEHVERWGSVQCLKPGKVAITSYDFERPSTSLLSQQNQTRDYNLSDGEIFDYPGVYTKSADCAQYADRQEGVRGPPGRPLRVQAAAPLSLEQVTAIIENAPTIAIPEKLHQKHSETYGGRQNQKIDDVRRIEHDAGNFSKAAKENTDAILKHVDKFDPGCKDAYSDSAKTLSAMSNDDWVSGSRR